METQRLHFITILTIFSFSFLFCISRTRTVSAIEAAEGAVANQDQLISDSPPPLPYADQQEFHQEPFNPVLFTLRQPIVMNFDGFKEFPGGVAVNPLLSGDSAASTNVSTIEVASEATNSSVVSDSPPPLPYSDQEKDHQEPVNSMINLLDQPDLKNLDGFQELVGVTDNPSSFNYSKVIFLLAGVVLGVLVVLGIFMLYVWIRNRVVNGDQKEGAVGSSAIDVSSPLIPSDPSAPDVGVSSSGGLNLNLGQALTLDQIRDATKGFSAENFLKRGHSGDLFKGVLEDGRHVVIKRIDVESPEKKDAFEVEMDLFTDKKVSHPRLVSILGHYLDDETMKFLMYNYMPKRDLFNSFDNWSDTSMDTLGWKERKKIAIGTAEALNHLHHRRLVHRDIQERSILLDENCEVCLGSLSKVCTAEDIEFTWWQRLLRMSEPRSTTTRAHDVYCFGKILIGLVTGKLGLSMPTSETTYNKWLEQQLPLINITDRESMITIVDRSLKVRGNEKHFSAIFAMAILAKSCLNPIPLRRPPMSEILDTLNANAYLVLENENQKAFLQKESEKAKAQASFWNRSVTPWNR